MGLWDMIALIVVVSVLGGVAQQYMRMQSRLESKRADQLTTGDLRDMIREAVREELEPIVGELQRREQKQIGRGEHDEPEG